MQNRLVAIEGKRCVVGCPFDYFLLFRVGDTVNIQLIVKFDGGITNGFLPIRTTLIHQQQIAIPDSPVGSGIHVHLSACDKVYLFLFVFFTLTGSIAHEVRCVAAVGLISSVPGSILFALGRGRGEGRDGH